MIRYAISLRDLRARIKAIKPTWFLRHSKRATASLPAQPQCVRFSGVMERGEGCVHRASTFEMPVLRKTT